MFAFRCNSQKRAAANPIRQSGKFGVVYLFFHNFKKFDKFEIPISFRHKKEDTYTTWIGGLSSFLIVCSALIYCIIYFIPFIRKKNYSLYYYTINLNKTEEINFQKSKASLAVGFECSKNKTDNISIEDLLELKAKYNFYTNIKNGEPIDLHNCNEEYYYKDDNLINSIVNETFKNLKCFNVLNKLIKNRYQNRNDNFAYYQIDINVKENIDPLIANEFLIDNDCKIELYYIDVNYEFEDFEEPIKKFVYEIFLQLNPYFETRMNTYFMNSYFESNNYLIFETKSDKKSYNTLFSKTEQYYLHRSGNILGKIYIRHDTRRMLIKITYQTLTEFFTVTFSFLEGLFLIFNFIVNTYNRFCLNYSIGKKIIFFEGIDDTHFNLSKNKTKIEDLISKTQLYEEVKQSKSTKTIVRQKNDIENPQNITGDESDRISVNNKSIDKII